MPKPENGSAPLCTKCGLRPKSGNSEDANPWCKECRAEYQREYKLRENWRAERRGILRGIQAMREVLAGHFRRFPSAAFTGAEIAHAAETIAGPPVAD